MKKVLFLLVTILIVPVSTFAQDDMYFTSSSKKEKSKSAYKPQQSATQTVTQEPVIEPEAEIQENDTLYLDPNETFSDGKGEWVNGFNGSVDDYLHAKRVIEWSSLSSAIPVGSSLYWNLVNSPSLSFDWNIYRVGGLAYVTPTWSNPLYTNYRFNVTWGWGWHSWMRPWHSIYWGGFYDPWYTPGFSIGFGWGPFHIGWSTGWGHYWGGGYHWASGWHHPYYWGGGFRHLTSRYNARSHFSGNSNRIRLGSESRSTLDRRASRREGRIAGGHSITESRSRSIEERRAVARNQDITRSNTVDRGQTQSRGEVRERGTYNRSNQSRADRGTVNRSSEARDRSTYTRSSEGRSSTYNRPSSTRSTDRSVRSMSESRQMNSVQSRSRESNSSRGTIQRSSGSSSRGGFSSGGVTRGSSRGGSFSGGGFSGSSSRGGGFSGGASRGGGGGRGGRR